MDSYFEVIRYGDQWYGIDWQLVRMCCRHWAYNRVLLENSHETSQVHRVSGDIFAYPMIDTKCSRAELLKKVEAETEKLLTELWTSANPEYIKKRLTGALLSAAEAGTRYRAALMRSTTKTAESINRDIRWGEYGLAAAKWIASQSGNVLVNCAPFVPGPLKFGFATLGAELKLMGSKTFGTRQSNKTTLAWKLGLELSFALIPLGMGKTGLGMAFLMANLNNVKDMELALFDGADFNDELQKLAWKTGFSPLWVLPARSLGDTLRIPEKVAGQWVKQYGAGVRLPGLGMVEVGAAVGLGTIPRMRNYFADSVLVKRTGDNGFYPRIAQPPEEDPDAMKERFIQEAAWNVDDIGRVVVAPVTAEMAEIAQPAAVCR